MTPEQARAVLAEVARRDPRPLYDRLIDPKFPEQAKFVLDMSQFVNAQCTRRAGKSNGLGYKYYRAAVKHPNCIVPYFALTRESAKNIMWPVLNEINDKHRVGASLTDSNLTVTLPNKSRIVLFGADMKNFIQRIRGIKTPFAGIDEAQSFGVHLAELVDDILTPAISDYEDGQIALTGTPGPIPKGVYYDACQGRLGFSPHQWTVYQNPYMPRARKFVEELKAKKGWTEHNPTYRREWLNEWVIDIDALVYKYNDAKNQYAELPKGHRWERVLAVDYGWNDATAFAVVTFSRSHKHAFIEFAEGHSEMIPSEIAGRLEQLRSRFNPIRIVADTGGLGKSITEEFVRRYGIPIKAAEKTEKMTNISLMNGDFIDQRLWVHESLKDLRSQYEILIKGEDHKEDQTLPNDLCDAALYAYREAKHYLGEVPEEQPAPDSAAWAKKQEAEQLQREEEAYEREKATPWWAS